HETSDKHHSAMPNTTTGELRKRLWSRRAIPGWVLVAFTSVWKLLDALSILDFIFFRIPQLANVSMIELLSKWGWLPLLAGGLPRLAWCIDTPDPADSLGQPPRRRRQSPTSLVTRALVIAAVVAAATFSFFLGRAFPSKSALVAKHQPFVLSWGTSRPALG